MHRIQLSLALLAAAGAGACAEAPHDHSTHDHGTAAPAAQPPEIQSMTPSKSYPLETCVVSGDSLSAMGEPYAFTCQGTEVQLCCDGCIDEFKADPDRYLAKVRAAPRK